MRELKLFNSTWTTETSTLNVNNLSHSWSMKHLPVTQWTQTYKHMKKEQEGTEGDWDEQHCLFTAISEVKYYYQ